MTQALPSPQEPVRASRSSAPFARELALVVERALNREIAASTSAMDVLAGLDGQSFAVEVLGLNLRCVLRAEGERVTVSTELIEQGLTATAGDRAAAAPVDEPTLLPKRASATLRATPFDLLKLARSANVATLKGTSAEIVGSPEIAGRFAALLKLARPDLEDALARFIGDVPAHALARAARGLGDWLERAAGALRMNTAEFLQEESRALPAALEAQAFYSDVERLRDDVERAAARLDRLERANPDAQRP